MEISDGDRRDLERLEELESDTRLFSRWSITIEDVSCPSFEIYDHIILDDVDVSDLAFGLFKRGFLPDEIEDAEVSEWEEYTENMLRRAGEGDQKAQEIILSSFLERKSDLFYDVARRIIDGRECVGFEAMGVNVTRHGYSGGVPAGIRYLSYLTGEIKGDNLQNDGSILYIDEIVAIYDNEEKKFVTINRELMNMLESDIK